MRVIIFLLLQELLASAVNAFTTISTARASVTLLQASTKSKAVPYLEAPKNIPADAPGYAGFDPVGFTDNWLEKDWSQQIVPDIWTEGGAPSRSMPITTIQWMQEAEIKHGRVAMLATVGWIVVDAGIRFPGSSPVTGSITSSLVGHDAAVANGSLGMLLLITFVLELAGGAAIYEQAKGSGRQVGDFSFDPLGFGKNPATLKRYKENEIANGRLAMLAFSGIVTQSALGCPFPYF